MSLVIKRPLCVCSVTRSCLTVTPRAIACQAPVSMGFLRQETWGGLPCLPPGDLPDPGTECGSPALQVDSLPLSRWRSSFGHDNLRSTGGRL